MTMAKATVDIRDELLAEARAQAARERTTLVRRVRVTSASMRTGVTRGVPLVWLSRRIARSALLTTHTVR